MNAISKLSMNAKVHETGDANKVIQGLWIGPELSVMEQLSITSFLRNGHEYHLYVYDTVKNIPIGTVIKNGHDILPSSRIFQYADRPTYAGFANWFRYKLLFERGGWWADTDTICLKPFDFSERYVFASEINQGVEIVVNGIIKVPARSEIMDYACGVCQTKNPKRLVWGETGPRLMSQAVKDYELESYKQPYYVFCPIVYSEWHKVLEPYVAAVHKGAYAIHLWNEMWRLANQDKNATYHQNCIYEQLKRMYLSDTNFAVNDPG
jgi:mannosyltransferase OCH1-like enzyme